jgi:hypothetical protein
MAYVSRKHYSQAFPKTTAQRDGMALRDYFAAKALQGVLANAGPYDPKWVKDIVDYKHAQSIATICYYYADEMLKARDGNQ